MIEKGWTIATGGTDNHMFLWNVRALGLTGGKMEKILDRVYIFANKNSIVGDKSAMNPGAIRIGTPAVTSRGMKEEDMRTLVGFYSQAVDIALEIQEKHGKKLKDFEAALVGDEFKEKLDALQTEVRTFCKQFPVPASLV